MRVKIGDIVRVDSKMFIDFDRITVGKEYEVIKTYHLTDDFVIVDDDGREHDMSIEQVTIMNDDDKPILDAIGELTKRIQRNKEEIDELEKLRDGLKKLRQEG